MNTDATYLNILSILRSRQNYFHRNAARQEKTYHAIVKDHLNQAVTMQQTYLWL